MLAKQQCCRSNSPTLSVGESQGLGGKPETQGHAIRLCRRILSTCAFVLALLLPKCPLCIAAWAATLGLSATWQHYLVHSLNPQMRLAFIGLLFSPLLLQLVFAARTKIRKVRRDPEPGLNPALSLTFKNQ